MKRIFTIAAALLMTASTWAQAPNKMSYQAVVRDASNALVTNQAVGMQISVLQDSTTGTAVYVETQTPSTNANGLVSLEIGAGTVISGDFTTIDWANGPYFIKSETDPTGGTTFTITGTSQLMSVPYALHAKTAGSFSGAITETDPIFGASVASGIVGADTTNWNNKLQTEIDGSVTNEIQSLSIYSDSLMISNSNKVGLSELNYWNYGSNNSLVYSDVLINSKNSSLDIGFQTNKTSVGNEELQGTSSYLQSTISNSNWMIGSKNVVSGLGTGPHVGVFGSGGQDMNYVLGAGVRYGVFGMSTDTDASIPYNSGVYGFSSGNQNINYGVDGTAGSVIGDNYANSGWAWGETDGTNHGLYGYATGSTTANYGVYGVIDAGTISPIRYSGYFKGAPLGVEDDNIYIKDFSKGVILTSPNGTCYQIKVDNTGAISTTAITCPN
jgi:hypothetical protein